MSEPARNNVFSLSHAKPLPAPSHWPVRKRRIFREVVASFSADYFRPSDRRTLIAFCEAIDMHECMTEVLEREGAILTDAHGRRYANPAAMLVNQAAARIASLGGKLRIHASARMRSEDAFAASRKAPSGIRPPWEYESEEAEIFENRYFDDNRPKPRPLTKPKGRSK